MLKHVRDENRVCTGGRGLFLLGLAVVIALGGCASNGPIVKTTVQGAVSPKVVEEAQLVKTTELHAEGPVEAESVEGPTPEMLKLNNITEFEYHIGAGDYLEFRSFDDETLNQPVIVRYDGSISLPMIPDVNVQDMTREEATAKVLEAYKAVFRDPQVSLTITQAASKSIHVMGDVQQPAEYPYMRPITVLDAINNAGGPRLNQRQGDSFVGARATLSKAVLIRRYSGERQVLTCDISSFAQPDALQADTLVLPGDIVYVPEGINLVYVLGQVGRADVFQLIEGTTLIQLLTRAGGFPEATARTTRVVLLREVDKENTKVMLVNVKEILKTGQDILLQPGDIVYIPQKPLIRLQQFVSRFTGTVSPVLNLYRQTWDTWYTDDRYRSLYKNGDTTSEILSTLESIRDFGSLAASISALSP